MYQKKIKEGNIACEFAYINAKVKIMMMTMTTTVMIMMMTTTTTTMMDLNLYVGQTGEFHNLFIFRSCLHCACELQLILRKGYILQRVI